MTETTDIKSLQVAPANNTAMSAAIEPFKSIASFESAQRVAKVLASSNMVPQAYRNNIGDCVIALELATRMQTSPFLVMQNMHTIQGRPSWSAVFIIAAINRSGRFTPLQFKLTGEGMKLACYAFAKSLESGEEVRGPTITMEMAKAEGWLDKNGSKWKTMPEVMIRYRAASFFGKVYAADLLMGMPSTDEVIEGEFEVIPQQPITNTTLEEVSGQIDTETGELNLE